MSENEKDKEIKKTSSEAESYENYEGEAIEDLEEGPRLEDISTPKDTMSFDSCEASSKASSTETDDRQDEKRSQESYEERKKQFLKEKWLSVTGKKPKNIPVLRKPFEEGIQKHVFFGDRKPGEVEKQIRRKLMIAAHKIETKGLNFGTVRQEVRLPALFSGLLCIRFDPSGEFMACSDRKGGVQLRETSTGNVILDLKTIEHKNKLAIRSVRYSPIEPNKIYVVGQTGSIQVFTTKSADPIGVSEAVGSTYNMDISTYGNYLAIGGKEGRIHVIDPITLQVISRRAWPSDLSQSSTSDEYHKMRIYGLRCHPTEINTFATGGWDNTIKIWDIRVKGAIRSINGPAVYGDGLDIGNNVILSATWRVENSLNLWDFHSGRLIKNIPIKSKSTKYEGEFLYTCRFFKDVPGGLVNSNLIAVGGSGFTDLLVINVTTDKIEQYFPSFKPIVCLDVSGNMLAYGGTESVFRIAEVGERTRKQQPRK